MGSNLEKQHVKEYTVIKVMWGLFSAIISSLHDSIHPQLMEKNPPKTACGCPFGEVIKESHTCNPLVVWHAFVSVQLHVYWVTPRVFSWENATTTTTGRNGSKAFLLWLLWLLPR